MKKWSSFFLCVLLASVIWLVYNLSQSHSYVVSQEVAAESNLEGRAGRSSDVVSMAARVRTSGFRLLLLSMRKRVVFVYFSPEDFKAEDGDHYSITSNQLQRYVSNIYGSGVTVESFLLDRATFRFIPENYKVVPVRAVNLLGFRPQYAQMTPLVLKPDSVIAYGPQELLDRLEEAYTSTISLSDIRSNVHGEARLEAPAGIRLSDSKVDYSFEVSRYVELSATVPITMRNVPQGVSLNCFPTSAEMTFRCVFPMVSDPTETVGCYVDYQEFAGSITGRCMVHHDNLPQGVIKCLVKPEVVNCVERLSNE